MSITSKLHLKFQSRVIVLSLWGTQVDARRHHKRQNALSVLSKVVDLWIERDLCYHGCRPGRRCLAPHPVPGPAHRGRQ
jgi:hypothetical protein